MGLACPDLRYRDNNRYRASVAIRLVPIVRVERYTVALPQGRTLLRRRVTRRKPRRVPSAANARQEGAPDARLTRRVRATSFFFLAFASWMRSLLDSTCRLISRGLPSSAERRVNGTTEDSRLRSLTTWTRT